MTKWPEFSLHRSNILRATYVTLVPALGLTAGTLIALTSPFRDVPGWPVWAALAIVVVGTMIAAVAGGKAGERYHRRVDRAGFVD